MRKLSRRERDRQKDRAIRAARPSARRKLARRRGKKIAAAGRARLELQILLWGNLDLIGNPVHTRSQLAAFESIVVPMPLEPPLRLFVDMSRVESLDPSAALYLVAQSNRLASTGKVNVRGNFPRAPQAFQLLGDVGFHKVMRTRSKTPPRRSPDPVMEICKGTTVGKLDPETTWKKLHAFLKAQLSGDQADAVYNALGECIENVKQHAFAAHRHGSWYALAIRPDEMSPARAIVLDIGQGIAASVRKPRFEVMIQKVVAAIISAVKLAFPDEEMTEKEAQALLARLRSDDWTCVYLASLGLRTQVPEKKRGTGLVGLRASILELDTPGALHVLSGSAAVSWRRGGPDPKQEILPPLRGTMVCLEFDAPSGSLAPLKI
jgi:hypothetical protein